MNRKKTIVTLFQSYPFGGNNKFLRTPISILCMGAVLLFSILLVGCAKKDGSGGNGSNEERPGTPQVVVGNEVDNDGIDAPQWVAGYAIQVSVDNLQPGDMVGLYQVGISETDNASAQPLMLGGDAPLQMAVADNRSALRFSVPVFSSELTGNTAIFARTERSGATISNSERLELRFASNTQLNISLVDDANNNLIEDGWLNMREFATDWDVRVSPPPASDSTETPSIPRGQFELVIPPETATDTSQRIFLTSAALSTEPRNINKPDINPEIVNGMSYRIVAVLKEEITLVPLAVSAVSIDFAVDTVPPPAPGRPTISTGDGFVNIADNTAGYSITVPRGSLQAGDMLQLIDGTMQIGDGMMVPASGGIVFNFEGDARLAEGNYNIMARAFDEAGNTNDSPALSFEVDLTSPILGGTLILDGSSTNSLPVDYMHAVGGETLSIIRCAIFSGMEGSIAVNDIPRDYDDITLLSGGMLAVTLRYLASVSQMLMAGQSLSGVGQDLSNSIGGTAGLYTVYCAARDIADNNGPHYTRYHLYYQ